MTSKNENRRIVRRVGVVKSDGMDKSIIVRRDRLVQHPLYKKYMRRSTRLAVHDADNTAYTGDEVEIVQTRPLSKTKRWRLVRVLRTAPRSDDAIAAEAAAAAAAADESGTDESGGET